MPEVPQILALRVSRGDLGGGGGKTNGNALNLRYVKPYTTERKG